MTFSEKLCRLRRREGLSQEALAEALGVSRQAVSRWEQGTALPDGGKLLPCARHFGVSVDWLLDEGQDWEDQVPSAPTSKPTARGWVIAGGVVLVVSLLGLLSMGILSSVFPAAVTEAPAGVEWVRAYTGLPGFLKYHHLEWLFALCLLTAAGGLWMLLRPRMQKVVRKNAVLQNNLVLLPIAAQAGLLYSSAQSLWWLQMGRADFLVQPGAVGLVFHLDGPEFVLGAGPGAAAEKQPHRAGLLCRAAAGGGLGGGGRHRPGGAGTPYPCVFVLCPVGESPVHEPPLLQGLMRAEMSLEKQGQPAVDKLPPPAFLPVWGVWSTILPSKRKASVTICSFVKS